jgi:hypothetical protein
MACSALDSLLINASATVSGGEYLNQPPDDSGNRSRRLRQERRLLQRRPQKVPDGHAVFASVCMAFMGQQQARATCIRESALRWLAVFGA